MKKVLTWFLNNLKWILVVVVLVVTSVVIVNNMVGSYNDYKAYEAAYNQNDLDTRSAVAAAPKSIKINDSFVTKYEKSAKYEADELKVTSTQTDYLVDGHIDLTEKGGTVALALTLEEKSFLDIDFVVASVRETTKDEETTYGVKDLLSNVDFIVNGETMEGDIDLLSESETPSWHHLVMNSFALPAGDVTITIKSKNSKNAYMPLIQEINLYSSQTLTLAAE